MTETLFIEKLFDSLNNRLNDFNRSIDRRLDSQDRQLDDIKKNIDYIDDIKSDIRHINSQIVSYEKQIKELGATFIQELTELNNKVDKNNNLCESRNEELKTDIDRKFTEIKDRQAKTEKKIEDLEIAPILKTGKAVQSFGSTVWKNILLVLASTASTGLIGFVIWLITSYMKEGK